MYTVREVAKLAHTTVKTLHYYHKLGLLIPEQTTEAGYRLYGKRISNDYSKSFFTKNWIFLSKKFNNY